MWFPIFVVVVVFSRFMLVFQLGRPGKKIFWRILLILLSVSFLLKLPPITEKRKIWQKLSLKDLCNYYKHFINTIPFGNMCSYCLNFTLRWYEEESFLIVNEIEVLGLLILQLPPRQLALRACTLNTILSEQHLSAIQTVHKHKCTFGNELASEQHI